MLYILSRTQDHSWFTPWLVHLSLSRSRRHHSLRHCCGLSPSSDDRSRDLGLETWEEWGPCSPVVLFRDTTLATVVESDNVVVRCWGQVGVRLPWHPVVMANRASATEATLPAFLHLHPPLHLPRRIEWRLHRSNSPAAERPLQEDGLTPLHDLSPHHFTWRRWRGVGCAISHGNPCT